MGYRSGTLVGNGLTLIWLGHRVILPPVGFLLIIQAGVFPISGFLVNPFEKEIVITPEPVMILT